MSKYLGLLVLILLFSCNGGEKPVELTPDDKKMAQVLVDIHVADAAVNAVRDKYMRDSLKSAYFKWIYRIHRVDSAWVERNRQRLTHDPVRMDSVYAMAGRLLDSLRKAK